MVAMMKNVFVLTRASLLAVLLMCSTVLHAEQFTIKDVQVDGLISMSEGFVVNSLPVRIGQTINDEDFNVIIQKLYETGYFADIKLNKDTGDVLVIKVQERPTIKSLTLKGNKALKTDPLLAGLSAAGLAENKPYNPSILGSLKKEIERQYVSMGMRGSQVQTKVSPIKGQNAVNVVIHVNETKASKIKRISIAGNNAFSDSKLKGLMSLRDSKGLAFWSKKDRYLKQALSADLDRIETFYRNNGFLKFAVESAQVNVDRASGGVLIDLVVQEGNAYTINDLKFLSQEVDDTREIDRKLSVLRGRTYSQQQVTELERVIKAMLGKQGFAFARVKGVPKFREGENKVDVIFALEKGKRSYVRRINFTGNTKTQDDVLRREMRQLESAPANTALIEQSRIRLMRLGFFKDVQVKTVPVDGRDDLVDVNFKVEEEFSGSISASLGYADGAGVQLGANMKQNNFMGTGKKVAVGVNRSKYQSNYNLGITNPYYTKDGVSRGFNVYYKKRNLDEVKTLSNYNVDRLGASVNFGYPLSETQRVGLALGYDKTDITTGTDVAQEIENENGDGFVDVHGKEYGLFNVNASWRQSSLNRGRFATKGSSQSLSLEATIPGGDLEYYKATYKGQVLFPLGEDGFALKARTKLGYGGSYGDTERLPFFEHYYAGGFNSVRGFEQSSLGPQSTPAEPAEGTTPTVTKGDTFGGNMAVEAGAELIFPVPFLKDKRSVQASVFVETGNVFDTNCGEAREEAGTCSDFDANELRSSVGLGLNWNTVIGPLSFSLSKPLSYDEDKDDTKRFQFSIGTGF